MPSFDYALEDGTPVRFEFEPGVNFRPRLANEGAPRLDRHIRDLMAGAVEVVRSAHRPGMTSARVRFGIRMDAEARWMIAQNPEQGQFQVEVSWDGAGQPPDVPAVHPNGHHGAMNGSGPHRDYIEPAVEALLAGRPIAIPTDTVYGLAVDPTRPSATDRLFAAKRRPRDVTLPVLVADLDQALGVIHSPSRAARMLMDRFWPGPLTIVVDRRPGLSMDLGDERRTVGIRCPDHAVPRDLAARVGPLATTSANLHGRPPAATAQEVAEMLGTSVELIVDGGVCRGASSTVVDCTGEEVRLIRDGSLPWTAVQRAVARVGS